MKIPPLEQLAIYALAVWLIYTGQSDVAHPYVAVGLLMTYLERHRKPTP